MQIEFNTRNERQLEACDAWLDDSVQEILYGGAKGGGKSVLGAGLIFADALVYDGTKFFIARRRLIDLRLHTIPTIHQVFRDVFKIPFDKYVTYNAQDHIFNLKNGSTVLLIACDDIPSDPLFERFGSMQMTRGWNEEAGEIPEAADANLALSIGRWKNEDNNFGVGGKPKILVRKHLRTANPKKGYLKRDFVDPWKQNLLAPARRFIPALPTDNPYLSEAYVDLLRNEKDKLRRQRLFEGNWDYDDDLDSLISFDALTDSFSTIVRRSGEMYMIVDVARLGQDSTVISIWNGLELIKIFKYTKQTIDGTIQKIKDHAAAEKIPYSHILVDEDGVGGGVVDHLFGVKGFTGASTPVSTAAQIRERANRAPHEYAPKTNFANLKAQCGWKLAELINERKIALLEDHRDEIIEELTSILRDRKPDEDGKKMLRAKDDVKIELGRSPDLGDTILMRAYFELIEDASPIAAGVHKKAMEDQRVIFKKNARNKGQRSNR